MIEIFGKGQCTFCNQAKLICSRRGFEHVAFNTEYKMYLDMLKEKLPNDEHNYERCPYIFWNGKYIGGIQEFLDEIENTFVGYGEQKI